MDYKTLKYEVNDGIAIISVNRPDALNALNSEVLAEILSAVQKVKEDSSAKALIVTGEGRAFVAGADVAQMSKSDLTDIQKLGNLGHAVMRSLEDLEKPVLAAVNGFALGGGSELALACDFIFASNKAKFGLPEVSLGIIPGFGGTQRLARAVGINKARELIFTADTIDAEEAKRIGLVAEVYAPEELMEKVKEKAKVVMSKGPLAISTVKRVINKGFDLSLDAALELEKQAFLLLTTTKDKEEGMKAFLEKRKPEYQGK